MPAAVMQESSIPDVAESVTVARAAELWDVSEWTVRRRIELGLVRAFRPVKGSPWRIPLSEIAGAVVWNNSATPEAE